MNPTLLSFLLSCLLSLSLAWNPTNSYAPARVPCQKTQLLRNASSGLNQNELLWRNGRHSLTNNALASFLSRANLSNFDPISFLATPHNPISIGIAFSGGGYRAMLAAAGQFAALDNRTKNSTLPGHLGGLLQASTYISALSGGSWLLGSIVTNNFSTIDSLLNSNSLWNLQNSIFSPHGTNILANFNYYKDLLAAITAKKNAGFETSITDLWGRALSYQFINLPQGGPALTWSDIQSSDSFTSYKMPLPIVLANGRAPDTNIISLNSTVFEFTPFELGSWDSYLQSFTDIKWLGTKLLDGIVQDSSCTLGFDNAGFVMGTSSSLFNKYLFSLLPLLKNPSGIIASLLNKFLTTIDQTNSDVALYAPNPFRRSTLSHSVIETADYLALVDGGEDGQVVPLNPLLQKERAVDIIFAFDNSADNSFSWPTASSLQATAARQSNQTHLANTFPPVPDQNTYINNNLYKRPLFLGCYAPAAPLIVWNSNGYYTYPSNTSTLKFTYSNTEMKNIVQNTYAVATYGNGSIDAEYPACVGCAIIQRELERRGGKQTEQCKQCFERYCWDGVVNNTQVTQQQVDAMWKVANV